MRRRQLKNAFAEAMQFRNRALIAFGAVTLALLGLGGWYFRLQVLEHDEYATRSEANRIKPRPVVPGRGLILDRKGRVLAENVPAFRLDVVPDEAGDTKELVANLSRIVALDPEDIERFEVERKARHGWRPITLKMRVGEEEAARFAVDRWRFPGVELVPYLNRHYLYGPELAHIIGYVGRIDQADLAKMGEVDAALTHTGKTGLERYYEEALRGKVGYEKIETNVEGRALRRLGQVPAVPGADLKLSIDLDLQKAMVAAFEDHDGSAVAIDPRTGEILAMVSLPSYDPNLFVNGISHTDYKALMDDPSRPLFNRNVLGGGPPGSTVKPLIALAGLDSGLRRPEDAVFSTGEFHIPGQRRGYRDAHGGAGWTDLRKSIAASVNFYYYKLAYDMGIDRFSGYMHKYGFGAPSGIDLSGENGGIVPSQEWKASRSKERWYPGETVIAGIGQGYWVATTLQLARGVAAIANGGRLVRPHLAASRRDGYDTPWLPIPQPEAPRITDNPNNLRAVQEGMMMTMQPGGTGFSLVRGAPYLMAGKTGTAQKISRRGGASVDPHQLPFHLRHQALFVGYAPADNPTIAVAVAVEHGGFGASTAGPIARKIFDAYLLGKQPEAKPTTQVPVAAAATSVPTPAR
ncbi:Penicillin-binding protein 2 [Lysobacter dokdonensis DS-58]|uniref:Peptidoglycan D,D-transpeptidase MrdA n=1 Tax=Lysobacter dokdonensis DS-58 TaxID=1300345 RepID=A0A0A2WE18_9GAMM|nr:Penicillin-binding protein 2 [Lysobacter dokdonensis DS-58]